ERRRQNQAHDHPTPGFHNPAFAQRHSSGERTPDYCPTRRAPESTKIIVLKRPRPSDKSLASHEFKRQTDLIRPNVVAEQLILLAKIQPAIDDHGVRPAWPLAAAGDFERAGF